MYSRESSRARSDDDLGVGTGLELHPRGLAGPGDAGADDGADSMPADHEGLEAAAEPPHVLDLGDGADLRVARADPGHEQELAVGGLGGRDGPAGLVGLDREGHDHARAGPRPRSGAGAGGSACRAVPSRFSSKETLCGRQRPAQARYSPSVSRITVFGRPAACGRPILQARCSSASPTEPAARSSSPKKRRGCSTTTTSGPSTSCSACYASSDGVAAKALESLDISHRGRPRGRSRRSSARARRHRPGTSRSRRAPRRSWSSSLREALQLGHNYIGTEHILLGLIREGEGVAAQVLQRLGADLDRVRADGDPALVRLRERGARSSRRQRRSARTSRSSPHRSRRSATTRPPVRTASPRSTRRSRSRCWRRRPTTNPSP